MLRGFFRRSHDLFDVVSRLACRKIRGTAVIPYASARPP
jgi:hypothetical protein